MHAKTLNKIKIPKAIQIFGLIFIQCDLPSLITVKRAKSSTVRVISLTNIAFPSSNPEERKGVKSRGTPTPANTNIESINFFTN